MSSHDGPPPPPEDAPTGASAAEGGVGTGTRKPRRGFVRRHPVVIGLVTVFSLLVGCGAAYALYLNHTIGTISHANVTGALDPEKRPQKADNEALNILMAGVDNGNGNSVSNLIDTGWKPGVFRSDTIMILHVTADRNHAYLVSIPRDSYVRIYNGNGHFAEMNKVNAALSVYGPGAYVSTIEHLTGLRMDHELFVDWSGFKDISIALGGVEVYIPQTFYDTSQKHMWYEGSQNLEGQDALAYVRTRYNLPDGSGDFGRIARQQNFLRSMMSKMLSQGTMANPIRLTNTLKAVVKHITVDNEFSTGEIRSLALSLRGLHTDDVTFLTAPWSGYGDEAGSTVELDKRQCAALWKAMGADDIAGYLDKYGPDSGLLKPPKHVS